MKTFTKKSDIKFNEVNYDFLKRFEKFHLTKEDSNLNGLAAYLRTIRAIYNKAKMVVLTRKHTPFLIIRLE